MAAVCVTARSSCEHEPIRHMETWRDVYDLWRSPGKEFIGVSDSTMGFHLGEILDVAKPRTLIIDRPLHEVQISSSALGVAIHSNILKILRDRIAPFWCHPLVAVVSYNDLKNSDIVAACLRHLMPGLLVDIDLIDKMQDQNIQVDFWSYARDFSAREKDFPKLFGQDVVNAINAIGKM